MAKLKNEKAQKVVDIARKGAIPNILKLFPAIWGMTQKNFCKEFYEKTHYSLEPILKQAKRAFPIDDDKLREKLPIVIEEIFDEYKNSSELTHKQQKYINENQEHIKVFSANLFGRLNLYYRLYDWAKRADKCLEAIFSPENTAHMIYNHILNLFPDYDTKNLVIQSLRKCSYSDIIDRDYRDKSTRH